jgi:hypothetical protein
LIQTIDTKKEIAKVANTSHDTVRTIVSRGRWSRHDCCPSSPAQPPLHCYRGPFLLGRFRNRLTFRRYLGNVPNGLGMFYFAAPDFTTHFYALVLVENAV